MDDQGTKQQPPFVLVPLGPILTAMIAAWCLLFDIGLIAAHALTGGRHPSLVKVAVCTAITIAANGYCLWTARKHKAVRDAVWELSSERIGRPAITTRQAVAVVLAVLAVGVLFAWVFFFKD